VPGTQTSRIAVKLVEDSIKNYEASVKPNILVLIQYITLLIIGVAKHDKRTN
jgi:hypothetical protein